MAKSIGFGAKAKINHTLVTYKLTAPAVKHLLLLSLNFTTWNKRHLDNQNNTHSVVFLLIPKGTETVYTQINTGPSSRATQNTAQKNYIKSKNFSFCSCAAILRGMTASELGLCFIHSFIHPLIFFSLSQPPPSCLSYLSALHTNSQLYNTLHSFMRR